MQISQLPDKFPIRFGENAGSGFIQKQIPTLSQIGVGDSARASLNDAFPPNTFLPVGSGGVPPYGQDASGILYMLSAWARWASAGGNVQFDSNFSAAIGGYPNGTVLFSSVTPGRLWISTADNNTTNPDSAQAANWLALMLASDVLALAPKAATANVTIYVRPDGNDATADGSANTSAKAFQTISAAITYGLTRYLFAGFALVIQLGIPGTYAPPGIIVPSAAVNIIGDAANQAGYIISGSGAAGSGLITALAGNSVSVTGVTVRNTSTVAHNVVAVTGGQLSLTNVTLQQTVANSGFNSVFAVGGRIVLNAGNIFDGGVYGAMLRAIYAGATINISGNQTLANTPSYAVFASALDLGNINVIQGAFSGSGSGIRYSILSNSVIDTNGGGQNYFPGTSAGATGGGGLYVP